MGFFSSIGKAVKGVVSAVGGGDVIGAGLGLLGGAQANSATAASTKSQMQFQERMRNTAYQAAVADMRKAGLNPRLTYTQGAAASPAGASYSARDVSSSAREGMTASAMLRNIQEQNNNLRSQQQLNSASAKAAEASAAASISQAQKTAAETQGIRYSNVGKRVDSEWIQKFGVTGSGTRAAASTAKGLASLVKKPQQYLLKKISGFKK